VNEAILREELALFGRRLWERGLIGGNEGNLSARLGPDRVLATPAGQSKGHLAPDQMVVLDLEGQAISGGKPSSEIKLHLRAYAQRPDCQAVVHAHPPVATAYTLAGLSIPDDVLPEAGYVLGPVATVPFAMPGTDEVPDRLEPLLGGHKTFLISHHGAATLGSSLEDAYNRMETLERVARVLMLARLAGKVEPMPSDAYEALLPLFHGRLE